ncbi:hypothetical protein BJX63DRAFT_444794 [Aspergillus granulosus]|uniref:Uncharacterized protein n=1 Tax=Aspergillus granulosus TaxID=176169 RepID=A0ABR4H4H5_9EURO
MSASNFTWMTTTPGVWKREIDEVEQFYTSLAKAFEGTGRNFFAMTGFIALSVPIKGSRQDTEKRVEEALRKAWIRLRHDHPTIASSVQYDKKEKKCFKIYEELRDSHAQEMWQKNTFVIVDNGVSGLEWCNSDPPVPDLPTLFLIKAPESTSQVDEGRFYADLVLRSHHDIIDGMGTLMLFNNLVAHTAKAYEEGASYTLPIFGDEFGRLSPPLRIAAEIPSDLQPAYCKRMEEIREFNSTLRADVEVMAVPFKRDQEGPGKHQRVAIKLSCDQTGRLIKACRNAGLSITHAYHAAIALAVRDLQEKRGEQRKVRYINYSLINERGHCVEPYSTLAHPASVYHSVSGKGLAVDLTVPAASGNLESNSAQEYTDTANIIREYYLDIRDDKEHIYLVPSYWDMGTIPYPEDGKTPPVPPRNDSPSVSISSMGILDKVITHRYGDFEVEDPWVTGEELGTGLGLFLGTWKGRLTLSAAYNEAWHDKKGVLEFLEKCNHLTFRGLGVNLQA